jgi:hypothetical protein
MHVPSSSSSDGKVAPGAGNEPVPQRQRLLLDAGECCCSAWDAAAALLLPWHCHTRDQTRLSMWQCSTCAALPAV